MKWFNHVFSLLLILYSLNVRAAANSCENLFDKTFKATEFVITLGGKKESKKLLEAAHSNLIANADPFLLKSILLDISNNGLTSITKEQKLMINQFRQDSSFLRSVFQTSSKKHESPHRFANFVRDFGHLKDMVNINEGAKAKKQAKKLLKDFVDLDLENLLHDVKPASKKSVKKYFKEIITDTRNLMTLNKMTVDELHDVRKNMRDILRYMQIQNEVKAGENIILGIDTRSDDTTQIEFLKKLNRKLGEFCDNYAGQIIKGELTEETIIEFPENLRHRVEWFLQRYRIEAE